ncbi:MAG TPA: M20/M25/M40 family metallo-hydrolase [Elusimicrobiales bacterium]|nr:M20/M25/M40 family metallo-hydrolase [Elusimicrobiales bacterium]
MKSILVTRCLIWIAALSAAFIISPASIFAAERLDWKKAEPELKAILSALVNINTSQPDGNEIEAVRYIYRKLNAENIDWDIYRKEPARANLVARLEGDGTGGRPLLLIAHVDTVDANPAEWQTPPFKTVEKDGFLYGRGVADAKDMVALNLATMLWLKRSGVQLSRDVIMLVSADEENGGLKGIRWLMDKNWDAINAGFALNAGGGVLLGSDGKPNTVLVGVAEKMYMDIKLSAHGVSAHSSVPPADSAIYKLSRALAKVQAYNPGFRLTETTRKFFKGIYSFQNEDAKTTIDLLLSGSQPSVQQAAAAIATDPFFNSQLRDTIVPTIVAGGYAPNVIPAEAAAVLNCRLLPDTNPDEFIAGLRAAIADDNISISVLEEPRLPFPPPMKMDDELFAAISAVGSELVPGAQVVGAMLSGVTDSEYLRRRGVITYGLGALSGHESGINIHGANERLLLDDLYSHFRLLYSVAHDFAAKRPVAAASLPSAAR